MGRFNHQLVNDNGDTVDGRNPAPIYKVLYILGGCLGFLNHQQEQTPPKKNNTIIINPCPFLGEYVDIGLVPSVLGTSKSFRKSQCIQTWDLLVFVGKGWCWEIRRSPVEAGSLSQYLQGFLHPRWLAGFLNRQRSVCKRSNCILAGLRGWLDVPLPTYPYGKSPKNALYIGQDSL